MPVRDALIVFAKRPRPGAVKTRLTALLTDAEAADLYAAFLDDALAAYRSLGAAVRLYLAGDDADLGWARERYGDVATVHAQRGDGLGPRMQNAFLETFAAGHDRPVIIGTDHPTLPSAFVRLAFDELAAARGVVLGPSDDGGYYLMGMNHFFPSLFAGMTYSHEDVLAQTLERVPPEAARTLLPEWYDVDTPGALARLAREHDALPPDARTRGVLQALIGRYPSLTGA